MSSYFSVLAEKVEAALLSDGFIRTTVPDVFKENEGRGLLLKSAAFAFSGFGEVRCVHITSAKIDIYNLFFYPEQDIRAPLLAAEFVVFNKQPVVLVTDVISPTIVGPEHDHVGSRLLNGLRRELGDLPNSGDMPDWYVECRSGGDVFLRPDLDTMDQLVAAFPGFVERFLLRYPCLATAPACSQAVTGYKDHHRENSPGLKLLGRTFGEEWTDRFLKDWFFA